MSLTTYNPVPILCDTVNDYYESVSKYGEQEKQDGDVVTAKADCLRFVSNLRTETLIRSGFWDHDLTDDTEDFDNGREEPDDFEMLIPDLDYDGDFDD